MKRALERLIRSENARNSHLLTHFVWPAARNSHLFPKKGAGLSMGNRARKLLKVIGGALLGAVTIRFVFGKASST